MVRNKDGDVLKSILIVAEVQKRACLYDTNDPNYGDRAEKTRSWEQVCENVVPSWQTLGLAEKVAASKEVQKRWRSIRDSYTKTYRQGKCPLAEQCAPGSRRYQYHRQMSFLLRALQNKKPRFSQENYTESSHHHPADDVLDKPTDKTDEVKPLEHPESKETSNLNQTSIDADNRLAMLIADSIMPEKNLDDDGLFMKSLIPLFKKMDDDTRLMCRIMFLKTLRGALQGHKSEELTVDHVSSKDATVKPKDAETAVTTRSADGSRPTRKRRARPPSPPPVAAKKRGPGRPRKVRLPLTDSDEEQSKKKNPKQKVPYREVVDDSPYSKATSIDQLSTPVFMKMLQLVSSNVAQATTQPEKRSVKSEPIETCSSSHSEAPRDRRLACAVHAS